MIVSLSLMCIAVAFGLALALSRPDLFALFLLPVGIFEFGADAEGIGGLANISAIWLLLLLGISLVAMMRIRSRGTRLSVPEICYLAFLTWCAVESARAQDLNYAMHGFLRLQFPFLSMYIARRTITTPAIADRLLKLQFGATFTSSLITWGMTVVPLVFMYLTSIFWFGAVFLDQCAIMALAALAAWKARKWTKMLLLAISLSALCLLSVNRTTIVALTVGLSVFAWLEYRKRAIVVLPLLYAMFCATVLLLPSFRDKMFYQPDKAQTGWFLTTDVLTSKNFNNDGRYAMWNEMLDRFFWPNPVAGAGLGATQSWFYSGAAVEALHTTLKVEHSEYVRLLADTGIVGLALYLAIMFTAFAQAIKAYRQATHPTARIFALAAACALPAFWVCMAFDNALLYVLPVAQYPTAFAAIAAALANCSAAQQTMRARPETGLKWLPIRPVGGRFAAPAAAGPLPEGSQVWTTPSM